MEERLRGGRRYFSSLSLALIIGGTTACASPPPEPGAAPTVSATVSPRTETSTPAPSATSNPPESTATSDPLETAKGRPKKSPQGIPDEAQVVTVHRIVDGDTLEIAALASGAALASTAQIDVRLLEIDTPETEHPSEPVQCHGNKATRALERLLPPGSRAWVQRDAELRDQYGRYLLYAWNKDGTFVNLAMVRRGHAKAILYEPNDRYWSVLSTAQAKAETEGKGLWGACAYFGESVEEKQDSAPPPQSEQEAGPEHDKRGPYPVPPPPPDRDCSDIDATDFQVRSGDPHRFDADGDGVGCES